MLLEPGDVLQPGQRIQELRARVMDGLASVLGDLSKVLEDIANLACWQ